MLFIYALIKYFWEIFSVKLQGNRYKACMSYLLFSGASH